MTLTRLTSWEDVEAVFAEGSRTATQEERVALLSDYYFDSGERLEIDPFSDEYLEAMLRLHATISGRSAYRAGTSELSPDLRNEATDLVACPPPYGAGSSELLGDFVIAWGFVLRTLALSPGQSVLEYGPGGGQLSIALARNGCDVSVIDVEPAYVETIRGQCIALGVPITAEVGEFGDVPEPGRRYDAVIFFEALHHSLRHNALLRRLHDVVEDGGVIAVAGEPIVEEGNVFEPTIPFAWGPRSDLLSLWAMRTHGWMELGFRESYFYEAVARADWTAEKHECPLTFRGNTYVLRRSDGKAQ